MGGQQDEVKCACGRNKERNKTSRGGYRPTCRSCRRTQSFSIDVDTSRLVGSESEGYAPGVEVNRAAPVLSPDLERLFKAVRKRPRNLEALCDELQMAPGAVRRLLAKAEAVGMPVAVSGDLLMFKPPAPDDRVQDSTIAPVVGEPVRVGVISDLHYGSRYCLRDRIADFVRWAYDRGVRAILVPGDIHDGDYRNHGQFELSHIGVESQADDAAANLPTLPGLTYHVISGNHDETFLTANGSDVVRALCSRRSDVYYYGHRGAFVRIAGTVVHLWHPSGGGSYAVSYKLQKRVEAYASGEKPHILLAGHWHRYCHIFERGVHALACPTFQGGGSAFGRSLASGAPAIGGLLLEWETTAHGTVRNFSHTYRAYFETEKTQELPMA